MSLFENQIRFSISPNADGVRVTWTAPLGPALGHGTYEVLHRLLEAEYGVESVEMRRYSAHVLTASHITSGRAAAIAIEETMNCDPEFCASLAALYPHYRIEYIGVRS